MRKLIISALSIVMMTGASAFAQDVVTAKDSTSTVTTTTTVAPVTAAPVTAVPVNAEIKTAELPQPLITVLTSLKAQGWEAAETATVVKDATDKIVSYTITMKNATAGETKIVNFDAEGKIL